MNKLCYTNKNFLWGGVICDVLIKLGVELAVICPGSRSAPLTYAFSTNREIESLAVLDERSAAFFALGVAKSKHKPVVIICTSGTAVANLFPAIIEARQSRVPLLVLTCDRPIEQKACSAGQTIDQSKIFGVYPNWHTELAMPAATEYRLRYLRQALIQSFELCLYPVAGPVHINIPFDEILAPLQEVDAEEAPLSERVVKRLVNATMVPDVGRLQPINLPHKDNILDTRNGLIVAGAAQPEYVNEYGTAVKKMADHLGWPILVDVLSPLRNTELEDLNQVINYDHILRNPALRRNLKPDLVLSIGVLPTSKVLRKWLQEIDVETYIIDNGTDNLDPLHRRAVKLFMSPTNFVNLLQGSYRPMSKYGKLWLKLESKIVPYMNKMLDKCNFMFEGKVPFLLSQHLPEETPVFIANSTPIRDAEYFWQKNTHAYRPYFNRGANGIDGTLSTAMGIAHASDKPAVIVTGDLAFLHDVNGLLNKAKMNGSLTVILINNNGGGIFENLPIAQFDPPFEEYFVTPQDVDFEKLAATHQVGYQRVKSWAQFIDLIKKLPPLGLRILEIRTDRKRDTEYRKKILDETNHL